MKIALLAAMDKEVALLKNIIADGMEMEIDGVKALRGRIGVHDVLLAKCGIGKVNAALNTYKVIRAFKPDLVINSGVAGGEGGLRIGELLVAGEVAYHDVWCGPGTDPGAADGYNAILIPSQKVLQIAKENLDSQTTSFGLIATGDCFISKAEEISRIKAIFPHAEAVDMESAAIGQTCISEGVEFAIIRVVSDTPGEGENVAQYKNFWSEAPAKTFAAVRQILSRLD
ncbi:MAG: 5'-methylthioadenosine/S-adenosylhomocysteine nucleosidase [Muribaculaceae bacterium]|nr:5'-methylthioadenosine/S-adenosylhomocysteine nucleosidase [Muribaculaceae bacterium]